MKKMAYWLIIWLIDLSFFLDLDIGTSGYLKDR